MNTPRPGFPQRRGQPRDREMSEVAHGAVEILARRVAHVDNPLLLDLISRKERSSLAASQVAAFQVPIGGPFWVPGDKRDHRGEDMRRLLYLSNAPWGYIKQRAQFLAEQLSRYYQVSVYYKKSYRLDKLVRNEPAEGLALTELFKVPLDHRSSTIASINNRIFEKALRRPIAESEIVWVTEPELFAAVEGILPADKLVIYDCMDDALEFPRRKADRKLHNKISELEKRLCDRADLMLVTSGHLKEVVVARHGISPEKVALVGNAISIEDESPENRPGLRRAPEKISRAAARFEKRISYVGCIGDWFDFDLVLDSLDSLDSMRATAYLLVGFNEVRVPRHKRLLHFGPVEHIHVDPIMRESDLLVMPFKPSELVMSINPVKLYEYVYSAKPCIALAYGETQKFEDYVYLYRDREEYLSLLDRFGRGMLPPKKNADECSSFAHANTWLQRGQSVHEVIESAYERLSVVQ